MKTTTYRPTTGFADIIDIIRDLWNNFSQSQSLGYRLAVRNIKSKYRQSIFGIFWVLLPPLATSAVWIFLKSEGVFQLKGIDMPYPVFVLTGTLLWQVFSESISIFINNLQQNRPLLVKINFPHEALIWSTIYELIFAVFVKLIILAITLAVFQVVPSWQIVYTLGAILVLVCLGLAIGLLLAPLSMLFKDIGFGIPIVLQFAMYLTPVVYARQFYSGIGKVLNYNPVTPILCNAREWIFGINTGNTGFMLVAITSFVMLLLGVILFKLSMQIIIERIGS